MANILSLAAIQLIERAVDQLFDRAKARYLGPAAFPKQIVFGFGEHKSALSLPGLFMSAAREESTVPDKDVVNHLVRNASNYMDAYRAQAKAQVVEKVQSFLQQAQTQGVKTDLETVLGGELAEVWKTTTNNVKRLIDTEASKARNMGTLEGIIGVNAAEGIDDPVVYFVVVRDEHLCGECKRLHLLPDGVTPKVWYLSEIGHGYHKRGQPEPKVGGLHPHCRCTMVTLMPGYGFGADGMVKFVSLNHDEVAKQRGLKKSVLDPNAGYRIEHEIWGENDRFMVIRARAPDGSEAGRADLDLHPDHIFPVGIYVEEPHRRKGLASAIFAHAERVTGKKIRHENAIKTKDGKAFIAGNERQPQFGKSEQLSKSDWPTSKYLKELERFGWVPTDRASKHPTFTNKFFTPTRPMTLKHSEMRRIGIENMENNAKDVGLIWDYNGIRVNPKHPYAEHYRRAGLLEPDPSAPPPMKSWTPGVPHDHVEIDSLISTKPQLEDWLHLKYRKLLADEGQHGAIPPISVMQLGDETHVVEGDEQLEAARQLGFTHVPVRRDIAKALRKSRPLKKSTPAGMTIFERLREKWHRNGVERLERWQEWRQGAAATAGVPVEELPHQSNYEPHPAFVEAIRNAPLTMNLPPRRLFGIFKDGRFKNLYETGHGEGDTDKDTRRHEEARALGIPKDVPPEQRPLYGALNLRHSLPHFNHFGGAPGYGGAWVVLRPHVMQRSTFTARDSFLSDRDNVFTADHLEALAHHAQSTTWKYDELYEALKRAHEAGNFGRPEGEPPKLPASNLYLEAQIYGGVSLDKDVAEIHIPHYSMEREEFQQLARDLMEKHKIPVFVHTEHENGEDHGFWKANCHADCWTVKPFSPPAPTSPEGPEAPAHPESAPAADAGTRTSESPTK